MDMVAHKVTHVEDPATSVRKAMYVRDLDNEFDVGDVHAMLLERGTPGNYLTCVYQVDYTWEYEMEFGWCVANATTYVRIDIPLFY